MVAHHIMIVIIGDSLGQYLQRSMGYQKYLYISTGIHLAQHHRRSRRMKFLKENGINIEMVKAKICLHKLKYVR